MLYFKADLYDYLESIFMLISFAYIIFVFD